MGSFNINCFVSFQAIEEGASCRVAAIRQAHSHSPYMLETASGRRVTQHGAFHSKCHATAFWELASDFVRGTYQDSEKIYIEWTAYSRYVMMELFRELIAKSPAVLDARTGAPVFSFREKMQETAPSLLERMRTDTRESRKAFAAPADFDEELGRCWKMLFRAAGKGLVFAEDLQGVVTQLEFAVMHDAAYRGLVQRASKAKNFHHTGTAMERLSSVLQRTEEHIPTLPVVLRSFEGIRAEGCLSDALRDSMAGATGDCAVSPWPLANGLHRLCSAYLEGGSTKAELLESLEPFMESRMVIGGVDALGGRFMPVAPVTLDESQEQGTAVAEFISEVSSVVRSQVQASALPFLPAAVRSSLNWYSAEVADLVDVHTLTLALLQLDGGVLVSVRDVRETGMLVEIGSLMPQSTLRAVIARACPQGHAHAETLTVLSGDDYS